jgi:fructokinase
MTRPAVGIGELLWDVFPDGRKVAGGAPFNFAFHCHQLGHAGTIVSRVGDDDLGRELRAEVRRLGLTDEFIQTDPERPTGTVRVAVDVAGVPSYRITEDVAWDHLTWDEPTAQLMTQAAAVCFGTLGQRSPAAREAIDLFRWNVYGFWGRARPLEFLPWIDPDAERSPGVVVFDINLRPPFVEPTSLKESFRNTNWVKLNADEYGVLAELFGLPTGVEPDLEAVAGIGPVAADTVVLTRGAAGCLVRQVRMVDDGDDWFEPLAEVVEEPAPPARVVDTVGAGDAFTAAMVCLHLEGRPLRDCVRFASHYAARVCEYRGATPRIDRAAVEQAAFGPP